MHSIYIYRSIAYTIHMWMGCMKFSFHVRLLLFQRNTNHTSRFRFRPKKETLYYIIVFVFIDNFLLFFCCCILVLHMLLSWILCDLLLRCVVKNNNNELDLKTWWHRMISTQRNNETMIALDCIQHTLFNVISLISFYALFCVLSQTANVLCRNLLTIHESENLPRK